jgi:hypothetical protein
MITHRSHDLTKIKSRDQPDVNEDMTSSSDTIGGMGMGRTKKKGENLGEGMGRSNIRLQRSNKVNRGDPYNKF